MAHLVEIIGITHNPLLPRMLAQPGDDPVMADVRADYALMRQRLAESQPDAIVVIASDHLNQWFMDNMPAFLVGKSRRARGPFPHEKRVFGLEDYEAPVQVELARWFVSDGFNQGVDFAFSEEFVIDHAFTVPMAFVRPEGDIPIVPVWTNVMAPPLPPASRFYTVGKALRTLITSAPYDLRVAVVSSGHLAVEVGGLKSATASSDVAFDQRMMELIVAGKSDEVVREAALDKLLAAGNVTPGFLNYVMLIGLAGGSVPRATALRHPRGTPAVYYMEWSFGGGDR